jgi:uncharacterized integral membrane protein
MQFLKTLFWVVLAVMVVLFANANWVQVPVRLWGGLEADVKLPVLLLAAFLLGFVPMLVLHRARLWGLHRRLESQERQYAAAQAPMVPPARPATAEPLGGAES